MCVCIIYVYVCVCVCVCLFSFIIKCLNLIWEFPWRFIWKKKKKTQSHNYFIRKSRLAHHSVIYYLNTAENASQSIKFTDICFLIISHTTQAYLLPTVFHIILHLTHLRLCLLSGTGSKFNTTDFENGPRMFLISLLW